MSDIRSVLVTGTSTGIGRACALRLAAKGFRVFGSVRCEEDACSLMEVSHGTIHPLIFDLADDNTRNRGVDELRKELGEQGLNGLVNNAATMYPGPLEFYPLSELRRHLEINLVGTIALTQACIPMLRVTKGRIVNISSAQERLTTPFFGPYAITKWGMRGLHQVLRLELRPWGIECILIAPGAIKTSMWKVLSTWRQDFSHMPGMAKELYGDLSETIFKGASGVYDKAISVDHVAKAVERALTSKYPKTEVAIGLDAKFFCTPLGRLPTRLREAIFAFLFKLPKKKQDTKPN